MLLGQHSGLHLPECSTDKHMEDECVTGEVLE